MTDEQPQLHPDTPVEPVTLARVAEIFDAEKLQYRMENQPVSDEETIDILRTGFSNAAIAMQVRENTLILDSVWRGDVPASEGPKVLAQLNQWNTEHFAPTLRFFETGEGSLAVSAVRELNISQGLSRNQVGAFVMSTLDAVVQSFTWLEQQYPELVTWEEHND
ncbi:YbjN domain-containing protein [Corynebacterium confusum]|uniref:YbjN domain-containing protein n=1 Tax=Corynebacterium confusum TaxID=71254 RepID=UPI0025B4479D|nr:YbjN domain-containing protein [Corynebacterium confusum]WJY89822.1 hypothetical protein CCONF_06465 [Corynebacterium confusum]